MFHVQIKQWFFGIGSNFLSVEREMKEIYISVQFSDSYSKNRNLKIRIQMLSFCFFLSVSVNKSLEKFSRSSCFHTIAHIVNRPKVE